jgi:SAM-dependent methyltransferase
MTTASNRPASGETTIDDPLAGSSWSRPETVAGFATSAPNATLIDIATRELDRIGGGRVLDLGCGAGRNAVPLASLGWNVLGLDLSLPMLEAAAVRARQAGVDRSARFALAPMEALPVRDGSCDFVIAHGIWNLASSSAVFRQAVREAARAAKPGAGLFVFTFSRNTLAPQVTPVAGEPFVFTEFWGQPQCFLTSGQLTSELAAAGFTLDERVGLRELNRRPAPPGALHTGGPPVIYEGLFRFDGLPQGGGL